MNLNNKTLVSVIATGAVALLVGVGAGAASATPEPVVERVVQTKEVTLVPDACLQALDLADQGFAQSAQMLSLSGRALDASLRLSQAILAMDYSSLVSLNSEVDGINEEMNDITIDPNAYNAAKSACRDAA